MDFVEKVNKLTRIIWKIALVIFGAGVALGIIGLTLRVILNG